MDSLRLGPLVLLYCCVSIASLGNAATAQSDDPPLTATAAEADAVDGERLSALRSLLDAITTQRAEIDELERRAEAASEGADRAELGERAQNQLKHLEALQRDFEEVASGVELDIFGEADDSPLDWSAELKELIGPVINELKRATTRPRELDRLGREIDDLGQRVATVDAATERLESLLAATEDEALAGLLSASLERWQREQERLAAGLRLAQQKRDRLLGDQTSLVDALERVTQLFFRSRGRNLLIAILAFAATWALIRLAHRVVSRVSRSHGATRGVAARVVDLVFTIGGLLAGTITAIVALYITGDWVLLTIASLFLVGLVWASRTALPRIWQQVMILLNLGGVREGERLVYEGVPYAVESLGFYTYLSNPVLTNGLLRLPLETISTMHSRPCKESEPWFPTLLEDWVLLDDGLHAKVINQTPELVTLIELGGARRTMPTAEFFSHTPTVLSAGFRISVTFGLDYAHQSDITGEIPATINSYIRAGLGETESGDQLAHLNVEFQQAGASSLDIAILADFRGEAAPRYDRLNRLLQRLAVDACNQHGWVIPFSQVTVHMAEPLEVRGP